MRSAKYLGIATAAAVSISSSLAFAASSPNAASVNSRRLAALSQVSRKQTTDPIVNGTGDQTIPPGATQYFFAESGELGIKGCTWVDIKHADGGAFDPNNTGKLVLHGMDVAAIFINSDGDDITQGLILGAVSPNSSLFTGGYAVTSPQSVLVKVSDLPKHSDKIAIIVEGDVTNTDTNPQSVGNLVDGVISEFGCR